MAIDWVVPYLAGLFDGEGYIHCRIRGRFGRWTMTDEIHLKRMALVESLDAARKRRR